MTHEEFKNLRHSERMELIENCIQQYNIEVYNVDVLFDDTINEFINREDWETIDLITDKFNKVYHDEEDNTQYNIYDIKDECTIYLLPSSLGLWNINNSNTCVFEYMHNYYWVRRTVGQSIKLDYEYQSMIFNFIKEKGMI